MSLALPPYFCDTSKARRVPLSSTFNLPEYSL